MTDNLSLNRLAIHHIDTSKPEPEYAGAEKETASLHPAITQFFLEMSTEVWDAPNTGSTRSARYVDNSHPKLSPSAAKGIIDQILSDPDGFFESSKQLAKLLYDNTPPQAKLGLLAILRLKSQVPDKAFVIILKIHHDDKNFLRVLDEDLTQVKIEIVKNMLLSDIQKGACIPHPDRDDYHLKIIDKQLPVDPAKYFAEGFLGCVTKKSDEFQVKGLLPALTNYAREKQLPLESEKLPAVIRSLQDQDANITTKRLVATVRRHRIYGEVEINAQELSNYIEEERNLGPIDIPKETFLDRGVRVRKSRHVTLKFRDPQLRRVMLSGPSELLQSLTTINGDEVTITIKTTRNGYDTTYE